MCQLNHQLLNLHSKHKIQILAPDRSATARRVRQLFHTARMLACIASKQHQTESDSDRNKPSPILHSFVTSFRIAVLNRPLSIDQVRVIASSSHKRPSVVQFIVRLCEFVHEFCSRKLIDRRRRERERASEKARRRKNIKLEKKKRGEKIFAVCVKHSRE